MSQARPSRTRDVATRSATAAAAVVLGLTFVVASGFGRADANTTSFEGAVSLTTDAGASALFHAEGLAPDREVSNCIVVTYDGEADPVDLRLQGASDDAGLGEHLALRVEAGSGGGYGDCAGFTGTEYYAGTLAGFVASYGAETDGMSVPAPHATEGSVSFRFTVAIDAHPDAQGRSSTSVYTWTAALAEPDAPPPDPTPPPPDPTPEPEPPATVPPPDEALPETTPTEPVPTPGGGPEPIDGPNTDDPAIVALPSTPSDPASPTEAADTGSPPDTNDEQDGASDPDRRRPVDGDAGGDTAGGGDDSDAGRSGPTALDISRTLPTAWEDFVRVATFVAERSSYLLLLVIVVLLFLAVQNRIDRKDPKLALAPREADLDLTFEPPPSEEVEG